MSNGEIKQLIMHKKTPRPAGGTSVRCCHGPQIAGTKTVTAQNGIAMVIVRHKFMVPQ